MGYGLSRTVVLFSTGPLLKKLWPLEVDLLASLILWSTFGFVCSIFAVVGFACIMFRVYFYCFTPKMLFQVQKHAIRGSPP